MEDELYCHTIAPALSVAGKRMYTLVFGVKVDQMKHSTQQGAPIAWDNRMQLFVSEEDLSKMGFKPGKKYEIILDKEAVSLR
ncbi:hypothetical protein HY993_05145 [Candidatus Micrarchaeota archaeon]|nr:hypothetical protein [Candidatus Micrarchaeota archaeon]